MTKTSDKHCNLFEPTSDPRARAHAQSVTARTAGENLQRTRPWLRTGLDDGGLYDEQRFQLNLPCHFNLI